MESENIENHRNLPENVEEMAARARATSEEYHNKYLRALADFDNYQKRNRLEMERTKEEVTRKLLLDLLPVWDNFELLTTNSGDQGIFNSIKNQFTHFLQSHGIASLGTKVGDLFDPAVHEAVMFEEQEGLNQAVIGGIFRSGFQLNGKILRPTQVKVYLEKDTNG